MSLSKTETADKIEVVNGTDEGGNAFTNVQVRLTVQVRENNVVISQSYKRYVILEGDDYTSEPANVRAVCAAAFGD